MNPTTLSALKESIEKWKRNADGISTDISSSGCPLCKLFLPSACVGCPVTLRTGFHLCTGTPYIAAYRALSSTGLMPRSVRLEQFKVAAQEEVEFLESLLPPKDGDMTILEIIEWRNLKIIASRVALQLINRLKTKPLPGKIASLANQTHDELN